MDSFSPMNYYQLQALQAAAELDEDLAVAAEAATNVKTNNNETVEVAGKRFVNSIDNFNAILDAEGEP